MFRMLIAALALATSSGMAFAQPLEVLAEGPAVIPQAKEFRLRSKALGRDMLVQVMSPLMPVAPGQKTAVAYVLDGSLTAGIATETTRMIGLDGSLVPSHIVAISYPVANMMAMQSLREMDMLHATLDRNGKVSGGGGAKLEAFIIDELKPFIEARFPVDPAQSYLVGQSYGGLFAANVLVRKPEAFAGYSIGSPSFWVDASAIEAVKTLKGAGRKVFVAVGGDESAVQIRNPAALFVEALRANPTLAVKDEILIGDSHTSMRAAWVSDGWRFLLAAPPKPKQ